MIDGYTRTCGLIGNPVEHTLSPLIHNYLAERTGKNLVYVPLRVEEGLTGDAVRGAYALNLLGCNVTVPYKSEVMPYLADIDPLAAQIGAVNTLVRTDAGFKGYNTDMPGLYRACERDGVKIEGEQVIILGAGGVARAVAVLLASRGADKIYLLNRTLERAEKIAGEVNRLLGREAAEAGILSDYRRLTEDGTLSECRRLTEDGTLPECRRLTEEGVLSECRRQGEASPAARRADGRFLVIQATSVGMHPREDETVIEDPEFYKMVHTGYDLIFNPSRTRFMQLVEEHGGRAFNGLGMLLYQGIIAYELWTGIRIEDALADEVYGKMQEAMRR